MSCIGIAQIYYTHCKRGPQSCDRCREVAGYRYALLNVCPAGDYARPMIRLLTEDGQPYWSVYDIVRLFHSKEEAEQYAQDFGETWLRVENSL